MHKPRQLTPVTAFLRKIAGGLCPRFDASRTSFHLLQSSQTVTVASLSRDSAQVLNGTAFAFETWPGSGFESS